ncbi:putative IBR domain, E3 ubiquitin ligase RBR family [Helianthus anomalus]
MAVALAKKKKWRKCPNCNFFVEKAEGCVHITCRSNHYGCRRQNGVNIGN